MDWPIEIVVYGKAAPAGSKRAFNLPNGKAVVVDANPRAKPWKDNVAAAAAEQYGIGKALTCAVDVEMVFVAARPKGHYGTGRNAEILKDTAPLQPTSAPDALKLARGVEDALTGVVWRDDSQITNEFISKTYGDIPRVEIRVRPTALTCVRDLVVLGIVDPPRPSEVFEQLTLQVA